MAYVVAWIDKRYARLRLSPTLGMTKKRGSIAYARYDKRPPAVILSGTKCSVRISGGEKRLPRYARNDKRGEEIAALRSQ